MAAHRLQIEDPDGSVRAICKIDDNDVLVEVEGDDGYADTLREWIADEKVTLPRLLGSLNDYWDRVKVLD